SWNRIHSEVAFSSSVRKPSGESSPFDALVRARVRYSGFGKDPTLVVRRAFRRPPLLSERPCEESAVSFGPGLSEGTRGRWRAKGRRPSGPQPPSAPGPSSRSRPDPPPWCSAHQSAQGRAAWSSHASRGRPSWWYL